MTHYLRPTQSAQRSEAVGGLGFHGNSVLGSRSALHSNLTAARENGFSYPAMPVLSNGRDQKSLPDIPSDISDAIAHVTPHRQEFQKDVHLYTYTLSEPARFYYEVECAKYQQLSITIIFDGSDNVTLEKYTTNADQSGIGDASEDPLRCTVTAPPFQRVSVGMLRIVDPRSKTHIKMGYKIKVLPPDEKNYDAAVQWDADYISEALQGSKYAQLSSHPTLRGINNACEQHNVNFVDVAFPPSLSSLGHLETNSNDGSKAEGSNLENISTYGAGGVGKLLDAISEASMRKATESVNTPATADAAAFLKSIRPNHITWRRPHEFLGRSFDLFQLSAAQPSSTGHVDDDDQRTATIVDGPVDIRPGCLGNFWLLGALACLAERPALIKRIFQVPGEGRNSMRRNIHGAYKLRICKNGSWVTVTVDDYFPCSPGGGPIFSRSNGAELWVLLIEKAFAKLHGGYAFLRGANGGWASQGLADLTGAPTEVVRFDVNFNADALWEDALEHDRQGQLLCASTKGEDSWSDWSMNGLSDVALEGCDDPVAAATKKMQNVQRACAAAYARGDLIPGHAYSVLTLKETRFGDRLVRIRNPWGRIDWTGEWSPTSTRWTRETISDVSEIPVEESDDVEAAEVAARGSTDAGGSFWMGWNDFLTKFASLTICRIHSNSEVSPLRASRLLRSSYTEDKGPEPWDEQRIRGYFLCNGDTRQSSAFLPSKTGKDGSNSTGTMFDDHFVKTAMYIMDVPCDTETSVVISLHQQDCSVKGARPYIDLGLTVMCLAEDGQSFSLVPGGSSGCQVAREVSVEVNLRAGRYVIIPTSAGAAFRDAFRLSEGEKIQPNGSCQRVPLTRRCELDQEAEQGPANSSGTGTVDVPLAQHVFLPATEVAFLEIFARLDADMDGVLSRKELDHFMQMSEGAAMQPRVYDWIISTFECQSVSSRIGDGNEKEDVGLTPRGFLALYLYIFESGGADEDLLWRDLKFMGYDEHLNLVGARSFVLSTHAPAGCAIVIQKVPYDREAYAAALVVPVKSDPDTREVLDADGDVIFYRRSGGNWGVSFAVENGAGRRRSPSQKVDGDHGQILVFTLDCSDSKNTLSHTGGLSCTVKVLPGKTEVVHHLVPKKQSSWQWQYDAKWEWEDYDGVEDIG